jgi:hypothetical protein
VKDFSIEHKQRWLDVDPALFWDLTNIAFSHFICNSRAGGKEGAKAITPEIRRQINAKNSISLKGNPLNLGRKQTAAHVAKRIASRKQRGWLKRNRPV